MKTRVLFLLLSVISFSLFFACTHKPETQLVVTPPQDTTKNTNNNNNNNQDTVTAPVVDTPACFQRDVLPVLTSNCAKSGCHDAITRADGYNFSTYATIMAKGVVAGNSVASKVYTKALGHSMPPYPGPYLSTTQLIYIKNWIDHGAHNDTACTIACDTTTFTYSGAVQPILSNYCYPCHSSSVSATEGGGISLDSYNGVAQQAQSGLLLPDIEHQSGYNAMPLNGPQLPDCKITQIRKWVEAGAQNN